MFCRLASIQDPPPRFRQCVPPLSYIHTVEGPSHKTKLFQGGIKAAQNKDTLNNNGIKLIVNLSTHIPNFFSRRQLFCLLTTCILMIRLPTNLGHDYAKQHSL